MLKNESTNGAVVEGLGRFGAGLCPMYRFTRDRLRRLRKSGSTAYPDPATTGTCQLVEGRSTVTIIVDFLV